MSILTKQHNVRPLKLALFLWVLPSLSFAGECVYRWYEKGFIQNTYITSETHSKTMEDCVDIWLLKKANECPKEKVYINSREGYGYYRDAHPNVLRFDYNWDYGDVWMKASGSRNIQ